MKERHSGFTLIELSIVLVIIGLIIGGILAGKELIHAAEIRTTIRQTEEFDTAVNAFELKYNCLPGDCAQAYALGFTHYWGSGAQHTTHSPITDQYDVYNGSGSGVVMNIWETAGQYETQQFFWELQSAGFITGAQPPNSSARSDFSQVLAPIGPGQQGFPVMWQIVYVDLGMVAAADSSNSFFPNGGHYYWLTSYTASTAIMPIDAYAIDAKIDDGLPRSGKVLASGDDNTDYWAGGTDLPMVAFPVFWEGTDDGPAGAASNFCVTTDTPEKYNVQNVSAYYDDPNDPSWTGVGSLCTLTVRANF